MTRKRCNGCKKLFPADINHFYKRHNTNDKLQATCKKCSFKRLREWQKNNREKTRKWARDKHTEYRQQALTHYGGNPPKCQCCKEREIKFLCIDHINGGGRKHRKEIGQSGTRFYVWLKQNNYPEGFQVLCHNCNMAKGFYGKCPHQET